MADIANDSLSARVHMHMFDPYCLLALTPFPRQGFDLHGVGAHELGCQVAEDIQSFDPVTLVSMTCDGAASSGDQFEQGALWSALPGVISRFREWSSVAFPMPFSIE